MSVIHRLATKIPLLRLRTILIFVLLLVLLLPLGSLYFLRFYENELVRQAELELIMQSAVISALYKTMLGENAVKPSDHYKPIQPQLDLSSTLVLPRRPAVSVSSSSIIEQDPFSTAQKAFLNKILLATQKVSLAGIRVLNQKGIAVAGQNEVGSDFSSILEVKAALAGSYKAVLRTRVSKNTPASLASLSRSTGIRVFTAFPIIEHGQVLGVVYLSRTPLSLLKYLYGLKEKAVILVIILLGLTYLIAVFLSSRLSRPIRQLIEQTEQVRSGQLQIVAPILQAGTYELAELSQGFSMMSHALYERTQYIEEFASHVSHEFKTPLTSMQGVLELLLDHGDTMTDLKRRQFLSNLQQDTERLKSLVSRLLEQARADTLQVTDETCSLIALLSALQTRYADRGLILTFSEEDASIKLAMPEGELDSIFSNLLDNSLQHQSGELRLDITQTQQHYVINLQDNGMGVSPANSERIFTPFFTTKRASGGTGLGLGIIASTLKAYGGTIELAPSEQGARFVLHFAKC